MIWVCAKSLEPYTEGTNEVQEPWEVDPSLPHEFAENQDRERPPDYPCDCTPVQITETEFNRRKKSVRERLCLA
jgi:hypothetical protein